MVQKATCIMLSKRLADEVLNFVDIEKGKEIKDVRSNFVKDIDSKTLLVSQDENVFLALRNISNINVVDPMKLNAKDIVGSKKVYIDKESLKILEDRLTNGK